MGRSRTHKMVRHNKSSHLDGLVGTALEAECSNALVKLPKTSWFRGGHQTGCLFAGYFISVFQLHVVGGSSWFRALRVSLWKLFVAS